MQRTSSVLALLTWLSPHGNDASFLCRGSNLLGAQQSTEAAQLSLVKSSAFEHLKQLFRQNRAVRPPHFHLLLPGEALGGEMRCDGELPAPGGCLGVAVPAVILLTNCISP